MMKTYEELSKNTNPPSEEGYQQEAQKCMEELTSIHEGKSIEELIFLIYQKNRTINHLKAELEWHGTKTDDWRKEIQ